MKDSKVEQGQLHALAYLKLEQSAKKTGSTTPGSPSTFPSAFNNRKFLIDR